MIFSLEEYYTTNSQKLNREWDLQEEREKVVENILGAEDPQTIQEILKILEAGFADPYILRYDMKSRVVDDDSNSKNKTGSDGVVRMKFPNMKFWVHADLRDHWISYTDEV